MKNKKKNLDVPFMIFVGILLVALAVTAVIMYSQGKSLTKELPSPSPSESYLPTESPSPKPTEEPTEPTFEYSLPRTASVSLSPQLGWDLTIGGSGADVLSDVVVLDKIYLFGTTDSVDFDMNTNDGNIFIAVLEEDGQLLSVSTFGSSENCVCLFAKPCYGSFGTTFLVIAQSEENALDFYLVPTETLSPLRKTLTFEKKVTFEKAVALPGGALVLVNEGTALKLLKITADGEATEIETGKSARGVDLLVMGKTAIVLVEEDGKDKQCSILSVDTSGKSGVQSNVFSDKARSPLSIIPDENGYTIPYKRIVDAKTVFGVMHVSREFFIDFDYTVGGADYDYINVFCDIGATKLKGYHIFCTRRTATGYKTSYENICTHGDLNDFSSELLENVLPTQYINSANGVIITGDVLKEGKSNFYLAEFSNNLAPKGEYVFGGDGNDVLLRAVTTKSGDFLLVGNTTSSGGDISVSFGKSDVVVMKLWK